MIILIIGLDRRHCDPDICDVGHPPGQDEGRGQANIQVSQAGRQTFLQVNIVMYMKSCPK